VNFTIKPVPAVQRDGVDSRRGLVLRLQQQLLVRLQNQLQLDDVRAPLFGEFDDAMPIDFQFLLGRRSHWHDPFRVIRGQPQDISQDGLPLQYIGLGCQQAGAEILERHARLRSVAEIGIAHLEPLFRSHIREFRLGHLLLACPQVGAGKHQRPIRLDDSAHGLLHAVLVLKERPLGVDAGQHDRHAIHRYAAPLQQRLGVAQVER
jgi:hypothetical protein